MGCSYPLRKRFVKLSRSIRKKRKLLKERRKQRERVELKMDLPGVSIADSGDSSMFSLSTINKKKVKITDIQASLLGRVVKIHKCRCVSVGSF